MNIIENFLKKGLIDFGSIIDKKKCKELHDKVVSSRDLSEGLFRSEKDFLKNPDSKKTNPGKGKNNFAEKFDLSFIEKNPIVKKNIDLLVGEDHEILLKNFVIGVPDSWIPNWLKKKTEKQLAANLGSYVKPEYRDVTYFRGIDFHMDLIDHANSIGDNITVYYKIKEGNKERIQFFKGDVLQIKGKKATQTFTIRKISNNVGVERVFPMNSPMIDKIEVNKVGKVRRARIFYLRGLTGKKARIKEVKK